MHSYSIPRVSFSLPRISLLDVPKRLFYFVMWSFFCLHLFSNVGAHANPLYISSILSIVVK